MGSLTIYTLLLSAVRATLLLFAVVIPWVDKKVTCSWLQDRFLCITLSTFKDLKLLPSSQVDSRESWSAPLLSLSGSQWLTCPWWLGLKGHHMNALTCQVRINPVCGFLLYYRRYVGLFDGEDISSRACMWAFTILWCWPYLSWSSAIACW